jgi:hypothetical protein
MKLLNILARRLEMTTKWYFLEKGNVLTDKSLLNFSINKDPQACLHHFS